MESKRAHALPHKTPHRPLCPRHHTGRRHLRRIGSAGVLTIHCGLFRLGVGTDYFPVAHTTCMQSTQLLLRSDGFHRLRPPPGPAVWARCPAAALHQTGRRRWVNLRRSVTHRKEETCRTSPRILPALPSCGAAWLLTAAEHRRNAQRGQSPTPGPMRRRFTLAHLLRRALGALLPAASAYPATAIDGNPKTTHPVRLLEMIQKGPPLRG